MLIEIRVYVSSSEEHFRSLGLIDEDDKDDDFISYNK
jgi:hypothetical protein